MTDHVSHDPAGDLHPGDDLWPAERPGAPLLSDIDVYRKLVRLGHTLNHLLARGWSTASATALGDPAKALRVLSLGLYRANLGHSAKQDDIP